MAKDKADFAQENMQRAVHNSAQRATEAASSSMNWMAEMAQQNLEQAKVVVEGMLTIANRMAEGLGHQASAVREHSIKLAEQTSRHTFEFGKKVASIKDPKELAEAHSEFVRSQANAVAECATSLGERLATEVRQTANTNLHEARRRSEAA